MIYNELCGLSFIYFSAPLKLVSTFFLLATSILFLPGISRPVPLQILFSFNCVPFPSLFIQIITIYPSIISFKCQFLEIHPLPPQLGLISPLQAFLAPNNSFYHTQCPCKLTLRVFPLDYKLHNRKRYVCFVQVMIFISGL